MILADVARYVEKGVLNNVVYDIEDYLVQPKPDVTSTSTSTTYTTAGTNAAATHTSTSAVADCTDTSLCTGMGGTAGDQHGDGAGRSVLHKPLVKCRIPHLVFEGTSESCNLRKVIQVCIHVCVHVCTILCIRNTRML